VHLGTVADVRQAQPDPLAARQGVVSIQEVDEAQPGRSTPGVGE
jgi:hypothetical protein